LQIIWNSSTRAELLKFVEEQRSCQGADGSYDLKDSHAFTYESLSKELCVGNVYLRVYNDQPDFDISEPEAFCVALVDFISSLIHEQGMTDVLISSTDNINGSRAEESVSAFDLDDESQSQQTSPNDTLVGSDEKTTKENDSKLIKNLSFGLTSLKVH